MTHPQPEKAEACPPFKWTNVAFAAQGIATIIEKIRLRLEASDEEKAAVDELLTEIASQFSYGRAALASLTAERDRLAAELKQYQPLTMAEADAAIAELSKQELEPITPEEHEHLMRFATNCEYRAEHLQERLKTYMHVNRALRTEVARLVEGCELVRLRLDELFELWGYPYTNAVRELLALLPQPGAPDAK